MTKDEIKREIEELVREDYDYYVSKKHELIRLLDKAFYLKKRIEMVYVEKKYRQKRTIVYEVDDFKFLKTVIVNQYNYNLDCDYIKIIDFGIIE